jgi:NAD(P)H-hydrate repair Nnr-like enzyme with NAD(P)H-hydrate dehydratase domain
MDVERDDVEGDRLAWVRRAAEQLGVTVLLKGSTTLVADPDGRTRVNPTGTPLLATAGSGDVLAGAIGGLLARGLSALDAAGCAAFLHGLSARLAADGAPVHAGDLITAWPSAVRAVTGPAGTLDG